MAAQLDLDVAAVGGAGQAVHAQPHQLGDPVLGVEDGPAPGFGGMSGDHRRDQGAVQGVGDGRRFQVGLIQLEIRRFQAAVLRWLAGRHVHRTAAFTVDVLGNVCQQREVGEGTDDRDRLVDIDIGEQVGQLGSVDLRTADPEGFHPGPLDQLEDLVAVLFAHGVTEDCTEQPDIVAHRLGSLAAQRCAAPHRSDPARCRCRQPCPQYPCSHGVPQGGDDGTALDNATTGPRDSSNLSTARPDTAEHVVNQL